MKALVVIIVLLVTVVLPLALTSTEFDGIEQTEVSVFDLDAPFAQQVNEAILSGATPLQINDIIVDYYENLW
jgi:hypothetical protein